MTEDVSIHRDARETIERQVKHMIHLIDDLMDISRVTKGKIDLRKENVTLRSILEHAIETSRPLIEQKLHQLIVNVPEKEIWLHVDPSRLSQIFSNLLNNAAKYTDDKGMIVVSASNLNEEAIIAIQDNGIGIPHNQLSEIFGLFSQVDSSLERSQGGLGIGLTLVRNLVDMHGGTIEAHSEGPSTGSTFIIRLPMITAELVTPVKLTEQKKEGAIPLRVLIVDDNEASAKTLGWMAEFSGHDVQLAHNGPDAIKLAQSYKPHVVMLDIGLPGMNGYDVCRKMREDPLLKNAVFIAQTGWSQSEHRKMSEEAGFSHHLVKPVDMDVLLDLLAGIGVYGI
jgi:CheY-like chemotaxis protein